MNPVLSGRRIQSANAGVREIVCSKAWPQKSVTHLMTLCVTHQVAPYRRPDLLVLHRRRAFARGGEGARAEPGLRCVIFSQIRFPVGDREGLGPRHVVGIRLESRIDREAGDSAEAVIELLDPDEVLV